ncbi:MAG: thioesterase family protein, partial [Actinomycetota bacterium]|nr:thioesterase family protein [Actinomycetota bacterium]
MTTVPDTTRLAADFLGLQPTSDDLRWRLPVSFDVCGATGTLHGGCGLGAAVAALELATGRPLAVASSQYLSRAKHGETVDIELEMHAVGNAVTQAGFVVRNGDDVVLRGHASLGGRDLGIDQTWIDMPVVPAPEACPPRARSTELDYSFTDLADLRVADQDPGDRRVRYWARLRDGLAGSSPMLSALADLLPSGMRVSIDAAFRGSSLDNTVRIASPVETDWVLIDLETAAFHHAVGHGLVRVFAETGQLLASGSQCFGVTRLT